MRHGPWSSLCATAADEIPTNNSRQSVSESSWLGYPARIRRSCDIGAPEQGGGRQTAPAIRSAGLGEGLKGQKKSADRYSCARHLEAFSVHEARSRSRI